MSENIITFEQGAQSEIPQRIYIQSGTASLDALYGPWPYETDLSDFSWTEQLSLNKEDLIGLTIGVKSADGRKVTEYQLEKQSANTYAFVKKLDNITYARPLYFNNSDNTPTLNLAYDNTFKLRNIQNVGYQLSTATISENAPDTTRVGTGVVKAQILDDATHVAPVYYGGANSGNIHQDYLYIKKSDLSPWFNPSYNPGNGISIVNNTISIDVGTDNNNKFLKVQNGSVTWAEIPSGNVQLEQSGGLTTVNGGKLAIKLKPQGSGLNVTNDGLYVDISGTGYVYWTGSAFSTRIGTDSDSSIQLNYTAPIVVAGETTTYGHTKYNIGLQNDTNLTPSNNDVIVYGQTSNSEGQQYGWYKLDNFTLNYNNTYSLNRASKESFGGIQAQTLKLSSRYILEEVDGEMKYVEHTTIDSSDDPQKVIGPDNRYIGAECTFIDWSSNAVYPDRLYADLTPFAIHGTPSKSSIPVHCAIMDYENEIKKQQFYIDLPEISIEPIQDNDSAMALFVYGDYDENAVYQSNVVTSYIAEYNALRRQYNNLSCEKTSLSAKKLNGNQTFNNIQYLFIDPLAEKVLVARQHYIYLDLVDSTTNCQIITYEDTRIDVDKQLVTDSFAKVNDKLYLKAGTKYLLYIDQYSTSPTGTVVVIKEASKSFAEIKNLIQ